jgi:tetratricopeptide (TPR) repeat protein
MQKSKELENVLSEVCEHHFAVAYTGLENYLLTHPQAAEMARLTAIGDDYQLMSDYWMRGVNDPQREKVYDHLLHRLFKLATDLQLNYCYEHSSYWLNLFQRPRKARTDWGLTTVRNELESYVADTAMLELEPEHIRKDRQKELCSRHQAFMRDLFDYILTSHSWNENVSLSFVDMLLSPTVDALDQQLMVSAISLAVQNMFDFNKLKVLMQVYRQSDQVQVRQRALVGWVLAFDNRKSTLYPQMRTFVTEVCADELCCRELAELQMQLYYCMDAESDERKIRDEIMPEIMKGSKMRMNGGKLEEMDEDTLEDILHPEVSEQNIERMEGSLKRMADMQKQGSDIYFAGFSQMKRFPFFQEISNWFMPFYGNHPAVSTIWNNTKGKKFLQTITKIGAFCDSDKYSFVLAFEQVMRQFPPHMLKMVEEGEASPMPIGGEVNVKEQGTPAFVRRLYLQNLYRFCRLYPVRSEYHNPFNSESDYLFFANRLFYDTGLDKHMIQQAAFLYKRGLKAQVQDVLGNYAKAADDYQYYMFQGSLTKDAKDAVSQFRCALNLKPDDRKAQIGLARSYFRAGEYSEALTVYDQLLKGMPESKTYQLNSAICLSNMKQYEKALKILYKMIYLYPDNLEVVRSIEWVLMACGRLDEAQKYDEQLTSPGPSQGGEVSRDYLVHGYCLWFSGHLEEAVKAFRHYLSQSSEKIADFEETLLNDDREVLAQYGIGEVEMRMMLDRLMS